MGAFNQQGWLVVPELNHHNKNNNKDRTPTRLNGWSTKHTWQYLLSETLKTLKYPQALGEEKQQNLLKKD